MEMSLLTGVNLILTIFDKEEGNVIQYLSDSVNKFKAIGSLTEMEVRKRHTSKMKNEEEDDTLKEEVPQYQMQNIVSEIYTNGHYDYLFNNGSLPDGHSSSDEEGEGTNKRKAKKKSAIEKKREKTSQYYRLKPPPSSMIHVSGNQNNKTEGQNNLQHQLAFIEEVSNPQVKDSEPIEPNAPIEIILKTLVQRSNSQSNGPCFEKIALSNMNVLSLEINQSAQISPKAASDFIQQPEILETKSEKVIKKRKN